MKRKTWTLVGGAAICAILVWLLVGWFSGAVPVDAARVKLGRIQEFVDEQAVTRLPETYLITMPSSGRIEAVPLGEGTPVRQGQTVARIVPADLELAVREARATVERLEASIRHNADNSVEQTGVKQAEQYVESMRATVEAAAAREEAGKAKFEYAAKNLGRVQRLFQSGAQTQDNLDQALLQQVQSGADYRQDGLIHSAMQALQLATNLVPEMIQQYVGRKLLNQAVLEKQKVEAGARLDQVLLNQQRGTIASPIDGVVLKRQVSNELYLPAGTTLLEIGRLEDLQVEADVLSLDVVEVKAGDPVEIYGPAVGRPTARGTVRLVYPAGFSKISSLGVEQQRVKVIIDFAPEDLKRLLYERHLGVGYRVRVRIFSAAKEQTLVIPRSSLFRSPDGTWQVYAVRNGRAYIQSIQIGLINDELAEVTSGLAEGDLVVVAPESSLADGQRVLPTVANGQ